MEFLANDFVVVQDSSIEGLSSYSPGICHGFNGRIVITVDTAGDDKIIEKFECYGKRYGSLVQGRIYISDDAGESFKKVNNYPFMHSTPFKTNNRIYVIGQCHDLMIIYSEDNGENWSEAFSLTEGQNWHQAPSSPYYKGDYVYLVMERRLKEDVYGWSVNDIAPVLMRGNVNSDLTKKENWTFASELPFYDVVDKSELDFFGVPFYWSHSKTYIELAPKRGFAEIGWLETNVVNIIDEDHYFYDKNTLHLFMRANTGITNIACMAKVIEKEDGTMETKIETVPSGKKLLYTSLPGGQMKFQIIYDDKTKLYWLLSTQSTDSMTKNECLDKQRYGISDNERNRLVLHFSKNCFDWIFAGIIAKGKEEIMSRHYASMTIYDDDLIIVSRSGNEKAKTAHDGNMVTLHKVKNFRKLVY